MPNAWSQTLHTSKRHTSRVSAFHRYHWFGVKLFPVGCAHRNVPQNAKKCCFGSVSAHATKFRNLHDSTRPHLHFDGLPPKSRDPSSLYRTYGALQVLQKNRFGLAWSRPRTDRGLKKVGPQLYSVQQNNRCLQNFIQIG